ncbi:uncharacterized protein B0P05DRAFT_560102 [Gilbertella persicaria]|uniref:uncharacterized protein n=1 Tax=Gilbertella persicaria TaxID=101096 RepID=UPI002220327D|nr:uncharacterized protein B0P05DRAFT_560102 [Gilbertella persicaria]KAI8056545.1 hypothetical protein B0P05DRAFT_560102 [Gilbertella persicaria]
MNSAHDTKEWHMSQAPLQNPCMAESPIAQSPQLQQHYPATMDRHYNQSFPQSPLHPPVHHQLSPSASFLPPGKSESDPRLPGMMALSQPGTPRPSHHPTVTSPKKNNFATSSFHVGPYPHPALNRKRGRSELFSTELGPFFSSTKPVDNLYALDRSTLLNIRIQAKMDRGFFLADNDWTCYRRNYFQVSGAFSIHGMNHYYTNQEAYCLVQVDGNFYPVHNFSMNISARVSNSDKKIELVQHTPKRDKGPQSSPSPKLIVPGGNLSMSSVGANQSIVTFERIQFKTATANNGKRRAAQQYYVCLVDLYAEIEGNQRIKIASCQSAPLVVRGRSPGHYSDNHERFENNMPMSAQPDERYSSSFPRPPMTPPGVMGPDYSSPYPYQGYPNYPQFSPMQPGMMPPTPTGGPSQQHGHPYMMPGMTSDPSSSESSSPDIYNNEFGAGNNGTAPVSNASNGLHEEAKIGHPQLPHPTNMNMPMRMENNNWSRSRMNSTGSHQSPIAYEQHNSYFSQPTSSSQTVYSNSSAPSTPYGGPVSRKYSIQQAS